MSDPLVPPAVVPAVVVRSRCSACCFNTMLITPAMASDPYCADAPSRSTSIRSMAAVGIAFRSTRTVPRPKVPFTCTSALACRRLPLTSTSTWSGPRPRRLAGLMWSDPSAMVWCEALNEGASVARIWLTSVWPLSAISCVEITSTGTGVSTAVRDVRAPTTTTSFNDRGVAASLKSAVTVRPGRWGARLLRRLVPDGPRAHGTRPGGDAQAVLPLVVGEPAAHGSEDHDAGADERRPGFRRHDGPRDRAGLLSGTGARHEERCEQRNDAVRFHGPPPEEWRARWARCGPSNTPWRSRALPGRSRPRRVVAGNRRRRQIRACSSPTTKPAPSATRAPRPSAAMAPSGAAASG